MLDPAIVESVATIDQSVAKIDTHKQMLDMIMDKALAMKLAREALAPPIDPAEVATETTQLQAVSDALATKLDLVTIPPTPP